MRWSGCTYTASLSSVPNRGRQVIDQVEDVIVHLAKKVSKQIAKWVNAPTGGDDESHDVERVLRVNRHLVDVLGHCSSLAHKDLLQDKAPTAHSQKETHVGIDHL